MRIWLVTIGEPLPTDGQGDRLHRTGMLAEVLASRGHQVLWWTSAFDHSRKCHRSSDDRVVDTGPSCRIWMMRTRGYPKNVSLARILDHAGLARRFRKLAQSQPPPDIIVAAMPTPGLALASADYGRQHRVPVVLDMRDMWPDIFVRVAPGLVRPLVRLGSKWTGGVLRRACSRATAIIGITRAFVDWGLGYAGRGRRPLDRDFPLAYPEQQPDEPSVAKARRQWRQQGLGEDPSMFNVCYVGTMSGRDLETVMRAARIIDADRPRFRFVLCGTGDRLEEYKAMTAGLEGVLFPGWVGQAQIWTLLRMSSVGLAPYYSTVDFRASIPNKVPEYFSAGLPVVSSLQGVLADLLREHDCGRTYANGDAEGLANILRELRSRPDLLKQMSEKARRLFEERFVAERVYADMADYLREVVDSARAS